MPTLDNHQSNEYTKMLLIGDSKSGKTGSLISLVKAGYKLRIIDMDNLLDVLKYYIQRDCPELIKNVEYRTLRDKRIPDPVTGAPIVNAPTAYPTAVRMMERWKYDDTDLGRPADWGPDCILVIDSCSRLCDAAYDFREKITMSKEKYDIRAAYGDAQDSVENNFANITDSNYKTNVIVICHVVYQTQPDGTVKGFPQGVGQKLSPKIPQYFSSVVLYSTRKNKRIMQTTSTDLIDLANPKPFEMEPTYPIETGLADFFKVLRPPPKGEPDAPKDLRLPSTNTGANRANATPSHGSPRVLQRPSVGATRRA
jgi:AAA domain